jgi:DNA-binding MurR/RpiR family transcriptional regulator
LEGIFAKLSAESPKGDLSMAAIKPGAPSRDPQSGALIRLRGVYPSLKTALQKVANLILRQPEMAIYASVNEVAAAAEVSEATVMRFCRILGFKGFQDFKIALARELVTPSQRESGKEEVVNHPVGLVRRVFRANLAALEETLEVLDQQQLQQAGQILLNCRRMLVVGVEGSGLAVRYACLRFTPLDLQVQGFTERRQMLSAAALLKAEDALLALSHSGGTPETLNSAQLAKNHGVQVIAITSNSLSPLTRIADLVLLTAARELTEPRDSLASFLGQMTIIDSLFALLQQARPEEARHNLAIIDQALRGES